MVNKSLITLFGGLTTAAYLCDLISKFKYFRSNDMLQKDGSFFITMEQQEKEIGLSQFQLRKCKKKLKEMGILTNKMKGIPPKEFYFLNIEKLVESYLRNIPLIFKGITLKELKELPSKNLRNINNIKYNNIKYKKDNIVFDEKDSSILSNQNKTNPESLIKIHKINPDQFEKFYSFYPKKADKGTARNSWNKLCKQNNRPSLKIILSAIKKQKQTIKYKVGSIKNPSTFINNTGWEAEIEEMNGPFYQKLQAEQEEENKPIPPRPEQAKPEPGEIFRPETSVYEAQHNWDMKHKPGYKEKWEAGLG